MIAASKDFIEMRRSEYARSLIEASRDPLLTISTGGQITDMNQATVNITGRSREDIIGTDFFGYFTDPLKAREIHVEVFTNGFIADCPLTINNSTNTDVLFNGSVYKDGNGKVAGAVLVARDTTEQKRIERELTEAIVSAELAAAIAEGAKEKAESAAKVSEESVKAKQQFLSNMSHEIRTPLHAIIGFAKVALKTNLTNQQQEYLSAIKMSGDALILLINDILDLAKVDSGKMMFEQTPFRMFLSISAMLQLFETKILEKNLALIVEYDEKIPEVLLGDSARLRQIILNLMSNAVKFTAKGKITVSVRLLKEDENKALIEFAVADTGIGIEESNTEKIFENFQQATKTTSRLYGGTGLGLAIVKQLIEAQGGKVKVKSIMGQGSTFSFELCFLKNLAEAEPEIILPEAVVETKSIKVLIVEDIPLNQLLMKTMLDDFGFELEVAANGKIALQKLEQTHPNGPLKPFDIILMDLQMPEMNGFEATEKIRNKLKSNIPIIALTADVSSVDLASCKAAGMNDYLAKPVDEKILYSRILGLVKKTATAGSDKVIKEKDTNELKCTDLTYLNQRTKGDPKLMMEMLSLCLEQTPTLVNTMKQGISEGDWKKLQTSMHKLMPSFLIMGIDPGYEKMATIVHAYAGAQLQAKGINELVHQIEKVCMQACNELQAEYEIIKTMNK
jgi:PAS domain S-box-containing protein